MTVHAGEQQYEGYKTRLVTVNGKPVRYEGWRDGDDHPVYFASVSPLKDLWAIFERFVHKGRHRCRIVERITGYTGAVDAVHSYTREALAS